MPLTASDLLKGPRGVRLCAALACELDDAVWSAMLGASRHPSSADARRRLISLLESIDPEPLLGRTDPLDLVDAVRQTVAAAMYWEAPDDLDLLLRSDDLRAALHPVASALVGAPGAAWWTSPVDLGGLRFACPVEDGGAAEVTPAQMRTMSTPWAEWRHELRTRSTDLELEGPASPEEASSGFWWSTPDKAGVIRTTRPLAGLGATELAWQEDAADPEVVDVWALTAPPTARVLELEHAEAWIEVVRRYPLDTTGEHRGDWYRATGRDGTWHTPDWAAVAVDYDAVHLTVAAYLSSASRALAVTADGRVGTMIAGWSPDQTWWLGDVLVEETAPVRWSRVDSFGSSDEHWEVLPHGGAPIGDR